MTVSHARFVELKALLKQARKSGDRAICGVIIESDHRTMVILADKSDFIYRKLKAAESDLLSVLQRTHLNLTKVVVTRAIKDPVAKTGIEHGGIVRISRVTSASDP